MCGIAGFIHLDQQRPASREVLERMAVVLAHRGPDGDGYYVSGPVALGHRRLAIIDPAGGSQPMRDPTGRYAIVFNGEIYNYREVRAELESRGVCHRTASDTEVLLYALITWGPDVLPRLNGMFAFALWDNVQRTLFCARDRAGQKPLYWTLYDRTFLFASEPKAFFQYPGLVPVLSPAGLQEYLANDYVAAPNTIYQDIFRIRAGHYFVWRPFEGDALSIADGSETLPSKRYWQIPEINPGPLTHAHVDELRMRLEDATVSHRIADVSIGVFLSGGIDSSMILGLLRRRGFPVATYTIGFEDPSFDEAQHAERIARHFGADHHAYTFTQLEFLRAVQQLDRLTDEPFGDASLLPTYLLSTFTGAHVKVALGGDGADELWAGYPTHTAHRWIKYYRRIPRSLRAEVIEPLVGGLPVSLKNFSFDFKAKRFVEGARFPFPIDHQVWLGSIHPEAQRRLLAGVDWPLADANHVYRAALCDDWCKLPASVRRILLLDFHLYLADDILFKVDRASMAASLEVRAPFLDSSLMDFVWRLPDSAKRQGARGKVLLRQALRDILPPATLRRPKKGFGIPVGYWFRGPLRSDLGKTLDVLKQTGLFTISTLDDLVTEHVTGAFDRRKQLWNLFALGRWWATWNPRVP